MWTVQADVCAGYLKISGGCSYLSNTKQHQREITWFLWFEGLNTLLILSLTTGHPAHHHRELSSIKSIKSGLLLFILGDLFSPFCWMKCTRWTLHSLHLIWRTARAQNSSDGVVYWGARHSGNGTQVWALQIKVSVTMVTAFFFSQVVSLMWRSDLTPQYCCNEKSLLLLDSSLKRHIHFLKAVLLPAVLSSDTISLA